jgi:hypothetical protein
VKITRLIIVGINPPGIIVVKACAIATVLQNQIGKIFGGGGTGVTYEGTSTHFEKVPNE